MATPKRFYKIISIQDTSEPKYYKNLKSLCNQEGLESQYTNINYGLSRAKKEKWINSNSEIKICFFEN
jgi:hypothetical protein